MFVLFSDSDLAVLYVLRHRGGKFGEVIYSIYLG